MPFAYHANSELVAGAWLSQLPGLNSGMVGAMVPEKAEANASLVSSGFVTYSVVGGSPNEYVPERQPVLAVKTYGFAPDTASRKPPWNVANNLAEIIANSVYQLSNFNSVLAMPNASYPHAQVQSGKLITEPRRVYGDRAYWAVYLTEIQLFWRELPT